MRIFLMVMCSILTVVHLFGAISALSGAEFSVVAIVLMQLNLALFFGAGAILFLITE